MNNFAPTLLDGYKTGHPTQYPENARVVFSNGTPRGSRVEGVDEVISFGLQYFVKEYIIKCWNESFFSQPVDSCIKKYVRSMTSYLGPGDRSEAEKRLRDLHELGYLPLEIWALPEGSSVPMRVPAFVMFNTRPDVMPDAIFAWVTNSIETIMSVSTWLPTTSATTALIYRKIFDEWARKTNPEMIDFTPWQGHDFSYRGHGSHESAIISGAGHALSFTGSDTLPVIDFMEEYYGADPEKELIVGSVNATEHSVMCMNIGKYEEFLSSISDNQVAEIMEQTGYAPSAGITDFAQHLKKFAEFLTFERLITEVQPDKIMSIVSDTFSLWEVVDPDDGICAKLKDKILARDGKVVIRPDSGDPVKIISGYMADEIDFDSAGQAYCAETGKELSDNEVSGVVQCLWDIFGGTETSTGYNQLDEHIGAIYGDSITIDRAKEICERLARKGFASTNLVFGIGSFTYQGAITPNAIVTRDTFGFAVKSTYGELVNDDGETVGIEIFKDPVTDDGLKKSAKGLIAVYREGDTFVMKDQATWDEVRNCAFVQIFADGIMTKEWTLAEIRAEVAKNL